MCVLKMGLGLFPSLVFNVRILLPAIFVLASRYLTAYRRYLFLIIYSLYSASHDAARFAR